MEATLLTFLGVMLSAVLGAGGWYAVRKQRSGRVDTTEAVVLWEESKAIRQELREELQTERAARQRLEGEVHELTVTLRDQSEELSKLRKENEDAHRQIHLLQAKLETLEVDMKEKKKGAAK